MVDVFQEVALCGHEHISVFHFPLVGLQAVVAIHSTVLGPALGGVRLKSYRSESEAVADAMRLAEGMTYKNALAGLNLGGGKACIIGRPEGAIRRRSLFLKFGECIQALGGAYITAEDLGTCVDDIETIKEVCPFVTGTTLESKGSGDPSPWTASGVFQSIVAACQFTFGSGSLENRTVAVQGLGHVGRSLTQLLVQAGAQVIACDLDARTAAAVQAVYGAKIVAPDEIYDQPRDIYAPCAVGQTVNSETLKHLKCKIIAGAANNQLSDSGMARLLMRRGILYCPDFVINAGGVISCAAQLQPGGWNRDWVEERVAAISQTIGHVLEQAQRQNRFPEMVALELAKARLARAAATKHARFAKTLRYPTSPLPTPT